MTFSDLKLAAAIHAAKLGSGDFPSSLQRYDAVFKVFKCYMDLFEDSYFPFSVDKVMTLRLTYRKSKPNILKAEVAIAHGFDCYFQGRNKGDCSVNAELGYVIPASRGGELVLENCQIECNKHNNQRGNMTIEEYLNSDLIVG